MNIVKTDIEGVFIVEPQIFSDERGYFCETFNERRFLQLTDIHTTFVQDNESRSKRGVVRGLHFQLPPSAQSKLVRCIEGEILDVAVDIRRGSPTYLKSVSVVLSGENHRQLFVPRGFAHGFVVRRGDAIVQYKCDNLYDPAAERAIMWNDPHLDIDWGIAAHEAILSAKDLNNCSIEQLDTIFDYNIDYYA
ncbi:MAG: dTDP-4-dehydrorhamnose 3,5-epimerase [Alistipes sp.]|nr:dTDP-4-dehydrorhamnose 3,5-epimerase [Alistipes sp.]